MVKSKPFLAIEDDILAQVFDKYIDREDALSQAAYDEGEDGERRFSLSGLGNCPRAQILNRDGRYSRRPRTIDNKRMLHERRVMHDLHEMAWEQGNIALLTEVRLTPGLPEGYRGRADAICHMHCDGCEENPYDLACQLEQALEEAYEGNILQAHSVALTLTEHKLYIVDRKGIAPGALRYQSEFPKYSHVLQVTGYSYALKNLIGVNAIPYIYYVPAGGSGRPIAYAIDPDYDMLIREITALSAMWEYYVETGELPDVKPLMIKAKKKIISRKEGTYKHDAYLITDWECNPLYCGYCEWDSEDGFNCTPLKSHDEDGDLVGTYDPVTEEVLYDKVAMAHHGYRIPMLSREISRG